MSRQHGLATLFVALGLGCAVLPAGCSRLFFVPEPGLRLTPRELGLHFEERRVSVDGLRLYGWFLPASAPTDATVVFFHGNAENISTHIHNIAWLPAHGIAVLAVDYRGFGRSPGRPTLRGAHRDTVAILRSARDDPEIAGTGVVVFGQSLGGALALPAIAEVGTEVPVRGVVLDAAPSDYRRVVRDVLARPLLTRHLRWPISLLAPRKPNPTKAIATLGGLPILIAHGGADAIVPVHHSRALFDAATPGAPVKLLVLPKARHTEVFHTAEGRREFLRFVREAVRDDTATHFATHESLSNNRVGAMGGNPVRGESATE